MPTLQPPTHVFSEEGRIRRKRYLIATLVTCGALLALGITIHLIQLLDRGMDEMRSKATYDLTEMNSHVRAAGEEIVIQRAHEQVLTLDGRKHGVGIRATHDRVA